MDLKEVRAEGPTCFISTTTDMVLDPQLETRTLTLSVDESEEQTKRIHELQALFDKKPWLKEEIRRRAEVIRNVIKLGHHSPVYVVIPFSDRINFPVSDQRTRRDRVKFTTLIKASAYLHEEMRPRIMYRGKEYIIAFPADFYIAKELSQKILRETLLGLPKTLERVLKVCRELEDNEEPITSKTVAAKAGCSIQTASRYLRDLNNIGYLSVLQGGKGRAKIYETIEGKIEKDVFVNLDPITYKEFLEETKKIFEDDPSVEREIEKYKEYFSFYISPLTGERRSIPMA